MLDRLPKWSQICSFARWFFFLKKIYLSFRSAFKYFLLLGERLGVKYYLPCANASLALSLYRCYGGAIQRSRELNIKNELRTKERVTAPRPRISSHLLPIPSVLVAAVVFR